ncbi:TPA: ead/Ea22-like family protein [Klebsiella variicola subsp. variicola]|uniref:ead/Ea22-like family protein n=1 Tax=Klebsiella variicola TaxID=244366 RepID=UPI00190E6D5D|nr:ead/Ea22-like family protein [Klebsiella variicola]HCB0640812.1 ead/Ea22-like family protein [Klebsiella variicola subsp. variicola]
MTDITELAPAMKAAAEKLGGAQWQTRKGFSGIEVIVKGSLEKCSGFTSFQPVAADLADTKTARAIALFSPANILALVEAMEEAQQRIAELESRTVKLPDLRQIVSGDRYVWSDGVYNYSQDVKVALAAAGIKVEAE